MAEADFYEILEVDRNATSEEIKRAYRKQAIKYHPDKNQGNSEAEAKFKEVNEAYQVLSDEQKRAVYDRYGRAGLENGGGFSGSFDDLAEIFDSFFGGSSRGRSRRPAEMLDIAIKVNLSFFEAVFGTKKRVDYSWQKPCETCKGTGGDKVTCSVCSGRGQVYQRQGFMTYSQTCPKCHGAGFAIKNPCKECKGTGKNDTKDTVEISIPSGIDTGQRLRVSGKGNLGQSGNRGDLYVVVEVDDDHHFVRNGEDIYFEVPVFFTLAVLGGEIEIASLRGKKPLTIPKNTRDKTQLTLKGEGIDSAISGRKGNLIAQVKIVYPDKMTADQEQKLRDLHDSFGQDGHAHTGLLDELFDRVKGWFK